MSNTLFVSGFSGAGYKEYGRKLISSFSQSNQNNYDFLVFHHDMKPFVHAKFRQKSQDDIPGLLEFIERNKANPMFDGTGYMSRWSDKERVKGYSYRFDAIKFCRMVYAMWYGAHYAHNKGYEYMVWLDGDTVIRQTIPDFIAQRSLPNNESYAYIGRGKKHTETGYLVFKVEDCLPILDLWKDIYDTDNFKNYKEWHSAFLFDRAREEFPEIKGYDLTPGLRGHAMAQCWVGEIFEHNKGDKRKRMGRSPESKPLGTYKIPKVKNAV